MTTYKCKCGRLVSKSTNADTTGNRDTAGCEGCPYLLPWGPFQYVAGKGYVQDIQGYECRMSKDLEYATRFAGSITDKCSCYIASLDFDFLARVSDWIRETYPGEELHGSFSVPDIRPVEYCSNGRYRMSITCAQNKKGVAAKAALLHQFFDDSGARLDMTPEEEKAHVLAAIEAGKEKGQEKGEKKKRMTYKDPWNGWLYRVSPEPDEDDLYHIEYRDPTSSAMFKLWPPMAGAGCTAPVSLEEVLAARARKNGWVDAGEDGELPEVCRSCQCRTCGNEECASECWKDPKAVSDCEFIGATGNGCADFRIKGEDIPAPEPGCSCAGCDREDCTCAGMKDTSGREECDGHQNCAQDGCSYAAKRREPMPEAPAPVSAPDVPETAPAGFDYSGLDAQTVADLHLAEREYAGGKKMAEMGLRRMADAVAIAHDSLFANCEGHNQHSEDTFSAWCKSIGLKKDAAYRMLQVSKLMDNSTPREQKVLEELSPSLLYAAAKPSAPAELVQAVKDGDITTNKQYQEALAQLKAKDTKITELIEYSEAADRRADAAEQRAREAAAQHAAIAKDCNRLGLQAEKAEDRAKQAEKALAEIRKERDGARDALQAAKLRGDRLKEENEALKARPIEASVVDSDEVDRLVAKRVEDVLTSQNIRQQEEQEQAAQDAYDAFILTARSLDNLWQTLKPQVARLDPDQKRGAVNLLLQKLMEVKEDLIHVCENHAV